MAEKGIWKRQGKSLKMSLDLSIPIAGLAKDDKHQTAQLLYGNPIEMIPLKRTSEAFYLLQRIQDEVHDLQLHSIGNGAKRIH